MKNKIGSLLLLFVTLVAISSCTMEKRRYQSGYYIDWGKSGANQSTASNTGVIEKVEPKSTKQIEEPVKDVLSVQEAKADYSASNDNSFILSKSTSVNESDKKSEVTATKKVSKYKAYKALKKAVKEHKGGGDSDVPEIVLILLCIFLPPIAVGLMTDWEFEPLAINILLCLLCWLPGIIHAFILYDRGR